MDEFSECLTESGLYQVCIRLFVAPVAPVAPAQDVAMAVMSRVAGLSRSALAGLSTLESALELGPHEKGI